MKPTNAFRYLSSSRNNIFQMTVSKRVISFNSNIVEKLARCPYVHILLDDEHHLLLLEPAEESSPYAIPFLRNNGFRRVAIHYEAIVTPIQHSVDGDLDQIGSVRVPGVYDPSENNFSFDLAKYMPVKESMDTEYDL